MKTLLFLLIPFLVNSQSPGVVDSCDIDTLVTVQVFYYQGNVVVNSRTKISLEEMIYILEGHLDAIDPKRKIKTKQL